MEEFPQKSFFGKKALKKRAALTTHYYKAKSRWQRMWPGVRQPLWLSSNTSHGRSARKGISFKVLLRRKLQVEMVCVFSLALSLSLSEIIKFFIVSVHWTTTAATMTTITFARAWMVANYKVAFFEMNTLTLAGFLSENN